MVLGRKDASGRNEFRVINPRIYIGENAETCILRVYNPNNLGCSASVEQPWRCDRSSDMCWFGMLPNGLKYVTVKTNEHMKWRKCFRGHYIALFSDENSGEFSYNNDTINTVMNMRW
jgi:hypothetical protein